MTVSEKTNQETLTRPPGKWRNWWRANCRFISDMTGETFRQGDVVAGSKLWPSQDAAETHARELDIDDVRRNGFLCADYIGAYPEGVTP